MNLHSNIKSISHLQAYTSSVLERLVNFPVTKFLDKHT